MQFFKLSVLVAITTLAAATPVPQLGGLPSLPVCLTGGLTESLPLGLNILDCAAGQTCQSAAALLDAVPILGSILGGLLSDLPVGVGSQLPVRSNYRSNIMNLVAEVAPGVKPSLVVDVISNMNSTDLTQCESYHISILPLSGNSSSHGTPPYYMMAWKSNGIPTVSSIGSNRNNLSWTVNQASGSSLLLTVADSQGFSGGEAQSVYNISAGKSSCLPSPPSTNITLVANISTSDPLETCELLGLRVFGGQKPYIISLAAVNSPMVTNVTLGSNDDLLTWPNRADPNGQVMAAVSDAKDVWGTSTGLFKTTGPRVTDDTCKLNTSTGNSTNINQHLPQPSKSHTAIIAGLIIPVVVLCLAGVAFYLWCKRQQMRRERELALLPSSWINQSISDVGPGGVSASTLEHLSPSAKFARDGDGMDDSRTCTSSRRPERGLEHFSSGSPEMMLQSTLDGHGSSGRISSSYLHAGSVDDGRRDLRSPPGVSGEWTVVREIVIQHQDGGTVQDIPPPYQNHNVPVQSPDPASPPGIAEISDVDPLTVTTRPSSAGDTSAYSPTPLQLAPPLSKGKGKSNRSPDIDN
ncbi:uncharacterized protein FOMMEDRAFT_159184 [Fomitiporia mediterranea MF3/22]|uniref:uncharacterized protein n=1 Tax=Fomitiporia mediterranea (strain MF3/22) TaxID=694068 RepID=UPI0004408BD9|nr:uncharacterized protein FOMMEDRAFT_159184 [Fomitiporia mediterranea MF3/22]EJD00482.1 hypothetical protein FOMMEDRAFT_159184 [Fomitiporia mediterranea MF3/22]